MKVSVIADKQEIDPRWAKLAKLSSTGKII